jgi:hypothetical protein|tara:strand:- start:267 stop:473 length:207 start_codon:yes stop_codon:yes gene_type:complete
MERYKKHELTQMPRHEKEGWSKLTWNFKGKERSELVKYPARYISKLWQCGVDRVEEVKIWTNKELKGE